MIMIIRLEIMLYTKDRKRHASFSLKAEKFIFSSAYDVILSTLFSFDTSDVTMVDVKVKMCFE